MDIVALDHMNATKGLMARQLCRIIISVRRTSRLINADSPILYIVHYLADQASKLLQSNIITTIPRYKTYTVGFFWCQKYSSSAHWA